MLVGRATALTKGPPVPVEVCQFVAEADDAVVAMGLIGAADASAGIA